MAVPLGFVDGRQHVLIEYLVPCYYDDRSDFQLIPTNLFETKLTGFLQSEKENHPDVDTPQDPYVFWQQHANLMASKDIKTRFTHVKKMTRQKELQAEVDALYLPCMKQSERLNEWLSNWVDFCYLENVRCVWCPDAKLTFVLI
jgi:hypothetical protein